MSTIMIILLIIQILLKTILKLYQKSNNSITKQEHKLIHPANDSNTIKDN